MSDFKIGDKLVMTGDRSMLSGLMKGDEATVVDVEELYLSVQDSEGATWGVERSHVKLNTKLSVDFTATYGFSGDTCTLYFNGKMHSIPSSDSSYAELVEHLTSGDHDKDVLEGLIDKPVMIARKSEGMVTVEGGQVFYKDTVVHSTLSLKLLDMMSEGVDIKPWAKFLENVMENPSFKSRKALYDFLEHFSAPITSDGHFLAYKRVSGDYKDLHSGTFDNSPGKVVSMPRSEVDDDSDRTCSAGLHACASSYLGSFYANSSDARVVVVKINPRDVVAVPSDYSFSKMRVCEYTVLGDAEESTVERLDKTVYTDEYEDYDAYDDYDPEWDDEAKVDGEYEVGDRVFSPCGGGYAKEDGSGHQVDYGTVTRVESEGVDVHFDGCDSTGLYCFFSEVEHA